MTDLREPLGRIVHQVRLDFEAERSALKDRPGFLMHPWEERHPEQRELDMRIGAAVAQYATAAAEAALAEVRQTVATFLAVRGEHTEAGDLAEGIRQVLDRKPLGKSSSEGESRD